MIFNLKEYKTNSTLLDMLFEEPTFNSNLFKEKSRQGTQVSVSGSEFKERAFRVAKGLVSHGLQRGDRVGIMLSNGILWEVLQFGIFAAGGVVVGIAAHASVEKNKHVVKDTGCQFIFVDRGIVAAELVSESLAKIIDCENGSPIADSFPSYLKLQELEADGEKSPKGLPRVDPNDVAIVIYSSGTTDLPKGLAYTHGQLGGACRLMTKIFSDLGSDTRLVCWLPLENLFQRMINYCGMLIGATTYFEPDPTRIVKTMAEIKPHLLIGVPRFYEKLYFAVQKKVASQPLPLKWAFHFALALGRRRATKTRYSIFRFLENFFLWPIFSRLFLRGIRNIFGGSLKYAVTGSAPLNLEITNFFQSSGVDLYEAYGLSEYLTPVAVNSSLNNKVGTVGKPFIEDAVRLDEDGEILVRGSGLHLVFKEGVTSEPKTDSTGWFKTGDLGAIDSEGFLKITGRRSDFIKTSTGHKIANLPIESRLALIKYVDHAFLIGEGRKCLVAFLSLEKGALTSVQNKSDLRQSILNQIKAINATLGFHVQIAGALVLTSPLTIHGGELTANLKIRKAWVQEKYSSLISLIYSQLEERRDEPLVLVAEGVEARIQNLREAPPLSQLTTHILKRYWIIQNLLLRTSLRMFVRTFSSNRRRVEEAIALDILKTVGPLKGPLVKIAQFLVVADILPSHMRKKISPVASETAPLSEKTVEKILQKQFGASWDQGFSEFKLIPFSTASIAQIHWARLKSGEEVAVKVKYPGAEKAIIADLILLRLLIPFLKLVTRVKNLPELHNEITEMISRECDFEEEARFQKKFAEIFSGNKSVVVPTIYSKYCTPSILTMDFIKGETFYNFAKNASEDMRKKAAVTIHEVTNEEIFRYGIFNTDPHPGNFLFLEDKVAFIDFGCFKEWQPEFLLAFKQIIATTLLNDLEGFTESAHKMRFFPTRDHPGYEHLLRIFQNDPNLPRGPNTVRPSREEKQRALDQQSRFFFFEKDISIPTGYIAISRVFFGTMLVIDQLDANYDIYEVNEKFHYDMYGPRLARAFEERN